MEANKKTVTMLCITLMTLIAVGCSGDNDNPVTRAAIDTQPPVIPTNVEVAYDAAAGMALISWAENTVDQDLVGFIVTRENYGAVEVLLADPAMTTYYQDYAPAAGLNMYSVYSVDASGNQSAVASRGFILTGTHMVLDLQQ